MVIKYKLFKRSFSLISAEQWHELPNFPNPNKWGYSMVSLNNDVYVTGGSRECNPLNHTKQAELTSSSCEECKTLSDFWQSALVSLTGGSRGSNTNTWSTTETWKYITREGRWVTVAPMLRPRTNHTSATLNGEIYVIGGKKINTVPACGALNLHSSGKLELK